MISSQDTSHGDSGLTAGRSSYAALAADLERLSARGRRRRLDPIAGLDFTSNDYLGFAGSLELRQAMGEASSRGVPVG